MAAPAPLNQPAFRSLWWAGLVSEAGDWLLFIALPIVVYRLTGSALGASFAFLAQLGPSIALSPFAGRLADRHDRRRVMLIVTALQAGSLLPLLRVHGHHGLGLVYGVIVVQAMLTALFAPCKNALLPALVAADQLVAANALVALNEGVARLAGGPLGGVLLAAGDLRTIVFADAASYAIAGLLLTRVPSGAHATAVVAEPAGTRARFRSVWALRPLRLALAVTFVADIAQGIFLVLFIVFVAQRLHGGAGETGLLRGVQAVGAIGAGLALSVAGRGRSPVRLMASAALAFGAISLVIWNLPALTRSVAAYAILFAAAGAPGVVLVTGMISFLQQAAPDHQRGRAFAALAMASSAGEAVGMIAAGVLIGPLGLGTMLNLQGSIYLATGLALACVAPGPAGRTLLQWLQAPSLAPKRGSASRGDPP